MTLSLTSIVHRRQDILSSNIDEETILLSIAKSKYFGIDPIGTTIWNLLDTPMSIGQIITDLERQYNVSRRQCQEDVLMFLEHLLTEDLLTVADD